MTLFFKIKMIFAMLVGLVIVVPCLASQTLQVDRNKAAGIARIEIMRRSPSTNVIGILFNKVDEALDKVFASKKYISENEVDRIIKKIMMPKYVSFNNETHIISSTGAQRTDFIIKPIFPTIPPLSQKKLVVVSQNNNVSQRMGQISQTVQKRFAYYDRVHDQVKRDMQQAVMIQYYSK